MNVPILSSFILQKIHMLWMSATKLMDLHRIFDVC